jgi:hypothetical protein
MMTYDPYRLYQAERAKSPAEVRRADEQLGRVAAAASSMFHDIMRPVRARRRRYPPARWGGVPRPAEPACCRGRMVETMEGS